ncbi:hypothetical protein [Actinotalea solisilvae]|uniref:hypothetical protein n=1 Tax=Actinotalea solisilvae TaxID=2072922 RepID=UPI0018F26837|nr:hypothetical protein [Actinotalea solisilvae]
MTVPPSAHAPRRAPLAVLAALAVPLLVAGCSATIETDGPQKTDRTGEPAPAAEDADRADATADETEEDGEAVGEVVAGGSGAPGNPFAGRSDLPILNATCTGQDLDVDEDGSTVIMTGPCGAITVTASWVTVNVDDVERLEVSGDNVTVIAKDVGAVVVSGSGNVLNLDRVDGEVEDSGRLNEVLTD